MQGITGIAWWPKIPWMGEPEHTVTYTARDALVVQAAARALGMLAASLAVNCAIMSFVAAPLTMLLITAALTGLVGELLCQVFAYAAERIGWLSVHSQEEGLNSRTLSQSWFVSEFSLMNAVGQAGVSPLVHESGHALAALACYKDANPIITIFPFLGGRTCTVQSCLSGFGELIGAGASASLVGAGGIIAATLAAMAALAGAHRLADSHPTISRALELFAYIQILDHVVYGLKALGEPAGLCHNDFTHLYLLTGIHPLVAVAIIILLPAVQQLLLSSCGTTHQSHNAYCRDGA